jgi:hypothetical protein
MLLRAQCPPIEILSKKGVEIFGQRVHSSRVKKGEPAMRSKRNLTRFTYENTAFQGWRLCLSRRGNTFIRYFSDKQYGSGRGSLEAAERALLDLKVILSEGRCINGKLSNTCVRKAEKLLYK